MPEKLIPQERPTTPEKSRKELYADTLRFKRDVLSSHYAMNSLRREVNERIDDMSDEAFQNDPEVAKYGKVSKEYNKRRKLFLDAFEGLSDEDKEKMGGFTSLTKVEVELSALGGSEEEKSEGLKQNVFEKKERDVTLDEVNSMIEYIKRKKIVPLFELDYWEAKKKELQEREEAEDNAKRREEIVDRIKELENILIEKYRILHQEVSVIDRRPLEEEIRNLEEEKARFEKELESPEGKVGKSWGDRIRGVFGRKKAEIIEAEESEKTELKPESSKQWTALGWLAERGKGILSAGIWEVRQAWRFQRGTKFASSNLETLSTLIHVEDKNEGDKIFNELQELMKENNITTVTAPEFLDIAKNVTSEKAAENNDRIEYIIKNATETLKERVAKYRGQVTAETVLTPENIKAVEDELRMQLNQFKDGATMKDVKNFARVMRDNMDKYWWLRYVYAPLEASLLGYLGYHYLPWSRWFGGGDLLPGGEIIDLSPEETGQRYIDHNMWEESKEHLKELGVDNPTNQEIQAVDSAAGQENDIRVVNPENNQTLWPETAGGQTKDVSMIKGLIKWGAAHKAALVIKAARIAAGI